MTRNSALRDEAHPGSPAEPLAPPLGLAEVVPWLVVLAFALEGLRPLADQDTWWHLRTGEWIVGHHRLPTVDAWSFASTRPWIPHEWLSEVLLFVSYRLGGYPGVLVLRALVLAGIAFVVIRECRRRGSWLHATIAALFGLATVEPGAAARPQLASFLLMAIFGPALLRAVERRRPPVWLIGLVWLWANLHGLWALAIVVYACVILGLAIDLRWRNARTLLGFVGVGVGMIAAAALTPVGPRLLLSPLAVRGVTRYITEWAAPQITSPPTATALVLVVIVVISWARSERRIPVHEITYVIASSVLALAYVRTGPLAGVLLAPMAARALADLFAEPVPQLRWSRQWTVMTAAVVLLATGIGAAWLVHGPAIRAPAPASASRTLNNLPGRARVLDEFDLGNWMLWTARDASPAVDGRYEIYGPAYIGRYVDVLNMQGDWKRFVADSRVQAAWLHVGVPLILGLRQELDWTVAWTDGKTVILVPPSSVGPNDQPRAIECTEPHQQGSFGDHAV